METEVGPACDHTDRLVPGTQRVRVNRPELVPDCGEQPVIGLCEVILVKKDRELWCQLRRYGLVPYAAFGLRSVHDLGVVHGDPAAPHMHDATEQIDVPTLQGACLPNSQPIAEHRQIDCHSIAFRHDVMDVFDLLWGGRNSLGFAFRPWQATGARVLGFSGGSLRSPGLLAVFRMDFKA
jgi:hypothetical protein